MSVTTTMTTMILGAQSQMNDIHVDEEKERNLRQILIALTMQRNGKKSLTLQREIYANRQRSRDFIHARARPRK